MWEDQRRGDGRRPPVFPTGMWNRYRRTIASEDRTNNHAEAAHRKVYAELTIQLSRSSLTVLGKYGKTLMVTMSSSLLGKLRIKNSLNILKLLSVFQISQSILTLGHQLNISLVYLTITTNILVSSTLLPILLTHSCQSLKWG